MSPKTSEETRPILRELVERAAGRQLAAIDILGHCLKYVHDLDTKLRVADQLDLCLRLFREIRGLYADLGWRDLESVLRERGGEIPYPGSRVEFGLAYYLLRLAERAAMQSCLESADGRFAEIARAFVEACDSRPEPSRFLAFAAEKENRPQAQQYLNRWLAVTQAFFVHSDPATDRRAVALGLRTATAEELRRDYIESLAPFLRKTGLTVPPIEL